MSRASADMVRTRWLYYLSQNAANLRLLSLYKNDCSDHVTKSYYKGLQGASAEPSGNACAEVSPKQSGSRHYGNCDPGHGGEECIDRRTYRCNDEREEAFEAVQLLKIISDQAGKEGEQNDSQTGTEIRAVDCGKKDPSVEDKRGRFGVGSTSFAKEREHAALKEKERCGSENKVWN